MRACKVRSMYLIIFLSGQTVYHPFKKKKNKADDTLYALTNNSSSVNVDFAHHIGD